MKHILRLPSLIPSVFGVILLMVLVIGCATSKTPVNVSLNIQTNPIPDIVIPARQPSKTNVRLSVGLRPFANPAGVSQETIGIIEDRMAELLGWTERCRVFETSRSSNISYSIEGTIRRYNITNYQTISSGKLPGWLKKVTDKVFVVNGEPVDWGRASWEDTNKVVSVDCEFSLRFKRVVDGELIFTATGGFSRISTLKSLAVDLAGFEMKRDHQSLGSTESAAVNSAFVQGRIIQQALGQALLSLIPRIDEELGKQVSLSNGKREAAIKAEKAQSPVASAAYGDYEIILP